jgi:hypothetical protein
VSTSPTPRRHALGLPAGSVRALLGLAVLAMLWVLALRFPHNLPQSFIYLQFLMLLILAHYFTAHGRTVGRSAGESPALGLPRGSIRLLLMGGYLGLAGYLYSSGGELTMPASGPFFLLVALLGSGFFLGYLINALVGGRSGHAPAWFQDIEAWLALLAVIALAILVMVYVVINPTLAKDMQINVDQVEAFLAAVVGFYFGARS